MKTKIGFLIIIFIAVLTTMNAQDVPATETDNDTELLGLPGDNLDLYAVLDLFQKSKTIEEFEKSLNDEKTGVNNLDLNLDDKVDFIKVESKQDKDDFVFVLQVDVLEGEIQDVAAILVTKDKEGKVTLQMSGNEDLYGKDYVIEPKLETPAVTANPGYTGADTVVVVSETSNVVVIESEPIIHYIYSPVYVPYYPPYYYGYYPPYYRPYPVIHISFYSRNNRYHRNHYHGGRHNHGGNTVVINNNNNTYNNYSKKSNTSKTVNNNKNKGNYKSKNSSNKASTAKTNNTSKKTNKADINKASTKSTKNMQNSSVKKPSTRPANTPSTRPASKPASRPAARPTSRPSGGRRR